MEYAARTMSLVLIEPQSCFAGAFARLLAAFAPSASVQTYESLDAAGAMLRRADAVVVDVDPGGLDPAAVAEEVVRRGGPATIVVTSSPAQVRSAEASDALLGIVRKDQPSASLAREILAVVRGEGRPGIVPDSWIERRAPGGSLSFVGRDRRGAAVG